MGDSEQQWVAMGGCGRKLAGESRRAVTVHRWTMCAGECEGCLVADNAGRSVHPNVWHEEALHCYITRASTLFTRPSRNAGGGDRGKGGQRFNMVYIIQS